MPGGIRPNEALSLQTRLRRADPGTEPVHTPLTRDAGIMVPVICGAMYPCSNPALVAAVSDAGGLGVVQPVALLHVHGFALRDGLQLIRSRTDKPIGFNVPIDTRSRAHREQASRWVDIAVEEGVRFFVASRGNLGRLISQVVQVDGKVYQDVTNLEDAHRAADAGVHGLVCVNNRAGGQPGRLAAEEWMRSCESLRLPLVCAGGIGDVSAFAHTLRLGYAGALMGTRFIATTECTASDSYKHAILNARERDIVHTERVFGAPLAVIDTPFIRQVGTTVGPVERLLLSCGRTRRWLRAFDAWRACGAARHARTMGTIEYWTAGESVGGIHEIELAGAIVRRFAAVAEEPTAVKPTAVKPTMTEAAM